MLLASDFLGGTVNVHFKEVGDSMEWRGRNKKHVIQKWSQLNQKILAPSDAAVARED
jgi:hypothetical protein